MTPIDIRQGKGLDFVSGVFDKASTHLGRIRTEAKLTSAAEKIIEFLQLEQKLDTTDAEELKQLGDSTQAHAIKKLYHYHSFCQGPYLHCSFCLINKIHFHNESIHE